MMRWILIAIVIFAAACAPRTGTPPTPAGVAFPTMTAGRVIIAPLPTPLPGALNPGIATPATAVALANQPTSTPDYTACPPADPALTLADAPPQTAADLERVVTEFLSLGGAPARLDEHLRTVWGDALGEAGFARGDLDLTGEGRADVIGRLFSAAPCSSSSARQSGLFRATRRFIRAASPRSSLMQT